MLPEKELFCFSFSLRKEAKKFSLCWTIIFLVFLLETGKEKQGEIHDDNFIVTCSSAFIIFMDEIIFLKEISMVFQENKSFYAEI